VSPVRARESSSAALGVASSESSANVTASACLRSRRKRSGSRARRWSPCRRSRRRAR